MKKTLWLLAIPALCVFAASSPARAQNKTEAQLLHDLNPDDDGQVSSYVRVKKPADPAQAQPQGQAGAAQAVPTDPIEACKYYLDQYNAADDERKDLVANTDGNPLVPAGGWAGPNVSQWVDDQRSIGMLNTGDLGQTLARLRQIALAGAMADQTCNQALQEAAGSMFPSHALSPLGGGDFQDSWPAKDMQIKQDLPGVNAAIRNLRAVVGG
ncbi:MAG: hypothetical protein KGM24_14215 [Elusimicrobia bacterium]|nr:hypothetical protein [Elusimicrobiota bacterium]